MSPSLAKAAPDPEQPRPEVGDVVGAALVADAALPAEPIAVVGTRWGLVVALGAALFVVALDVAGIVVALPPIGDEFAASTPALAWVMCGFALAWGFPLVAVGRWADRTGGRNAAIAGIALLAIGGLGAALAQGIWWLVAARVVQGSGACLVTATAVPLVGRAFPDEQRAVAVGVVGGIGAVGVAVAPLLAGLMVQEVGWRLVFLVSLPLLVLSGWFVAVLAEGGPMPTARPASLPDLAVLAAGVVAVVAGFGVAGSSTFLGPLCVVLGAGLLWQGWQRDRRLDDGRHDPLLDPRMHDDPEFRLLAAVAVLAGAVLGACIFFLALYVQFGRSQAPLDAGAVTVVFTVPFAMMSTASGEIVRRIGNRSAAIIAMAAITASTLTFLTASPESGGAMVVIGLALAGTGQGLVFHQSGAAAMVLRGVAGADPVVASRTLGAVRSVGIAMGVAVMMPVVDLVENRKLDEFFNSIGLALSAGDRAAMHNLLPAAPTSLARLKVMVPEPLAGINSVAREALASGLRAGMLVCVALSVAGVVVAIRARPATGQ